MLWMSGFLFYFVCVYLLIPIQTAGMGLNVLFAEVVDEYVLV
jgi:hypothetical protein